jgi:hypothetical protein
MAKYDPKPLPALRAKDISKFWANVDQSAGPNGCWPWTAGLFKTGGYGQIRIGKAKYRAHRIGYMLRYQEDAFPLDVLHRCDNPPCCNGRHLYAGTPLDNARDTIGRGRRPRGLRGADVSGSKLTESDVIRIRQLALTFQHKQIAPMFSVSESNITMIVNRRRWKHIP